MMTNIVTNASTKNLTSNKTIPQKEGGVARS